MRLLMATPSDPQAVSHVAMKLRDSALYDPFAYDFLRELSTRFWSQACWVGICLGCW